MGQYTRNKDNNHDLKNELFLFTEKKNEKFALFYEWKIKADIVKINDHLKGPNSKSEQ